MISTYAAECASPHEPISRSIDPDIVDLRIFDDEWRARSPFAR